MLPATAQRNATQRNARPCFVSWREILCAPRRTPCTRVTFALTHAHAHARAANDGAAASVNADAGVVETEPGHLTAEEGGEVRVREAVRKTPVRSVRGPGGSGGGVRLNPPGSAKVRPICQARSAAASLKGHPPRPVYMYTTCMNIYIHIYVYTRIPSVSIR